MNKEIISYILSQRWLIKHSRGRCTLKHLRKTIADKFLTTERYKSGEWTTEGFVQAWEYLEGLKIL